MNNPSASCGSSTRSTPPPSPQSQQIPADVSSVQAMLGRSARTAAPGDSARGPPDRRRQGPGRQQALCARHRVPRRRGARHLRGQPGADFVRGFATGTAIGDVRRTYTTSTLESLAYPQTGAWKNYRSLFYLHERFSPLIAQRNAGVRQPQPAAVQTALTSPSVPGQPAQRPRSNGLAIGKIRLWSKVVNAASLPAAINYPASQLARRHVYWREEIPTKP